MKKSTHHLYQLPMVMCKLKLQKYSKSELVTDPTTTMKHQGFTYILLVSAKCAQKGSFFFSVFISIPVIFFKLSSQCISNFNQVHWTAQEMENHPLIFPVSLITYVCSVRSGVCSVQQKLILTVFLEKEAAAQLG